MHQVAQDDKEDLLTYIDEELEKLKRSFSTTIQKFGEKLKSYALPSQT